jgi:glycosyltransferase involved in cell wall biosynthesis
MSIKLDDITIILPTLNEERNVGPFLSTIPSSVTLLVVDASEDSTPDLITSLRPKKTLVLRHPGCVTEARQLGAEAAQTPWLLFTDADIIFASDFFERLQKYDGHEVIYGPKLSSDGFQRYYQWFARGQQLLHSVGIPAASGSNLMISRRALMALGGFDLRLVCNEDSEIAWRAKRKGYSTMFASDLVVYARDHRRLELGRIRKTLHSVIRCGLLYFDLMPNGWRSQDWGYWSLYPNNNYWSKQSKDGR